MIYDFGTLTTFTFHQFIGTELLSSHYTFITQSDRLGARRYALQIQFLEAPGKHHNENKAKNIYYPTQFHYSLTHRLCDFVRYSSAVGVVLEIFSVISLFNRSFSNK